MNSMILINYIQIEIEISQTRNNRNYCQITFLADKKKKRNSPEICFHQNRPAKPIKQQKLINNFKVNLLIE